uniref:Recep_L_domain domain-containing protein n=2 Tax=Caenorhabditis japonica TaxID=281687 RepID=A0A8R1DMC2_CAEJA
MDECKMILLLFAIIVQILIVDSKTCFGGIVERLPKGCTVIIGDPLIIQNIDYEINRFTKLGKILASIERIHHGLIIRHNTFETFGALQNLMYVGSKKGPVLRFIENHRLVKIKFPNLRVLNGSFPVIEFENDNFPMQMRQSAIAFDQFLDVAAAVRRGALCRDDLFSLKVSIKQDTESRLKYIILNIFVTLASVLFIDLFWYTHMRVVVQQTTDSNELKREQEAYEKLLNRAAVLKTWQEQCNQIALREKAWTEAQKKNLNKKFEKTDRQRLINARAEYEENLTHAKGKAKAREKIQKRRDRRKKRLERRKEQLREAEHQKWVAERLKEQKRKEQEEKRARKAAERLKNESKVKSDTVEETQKSLVTVPSKSVVLSPTQRSISYCVEKTARSKSKTKTVDGITNDHSQNKKSASPRVGASKNRKKAARGSKGSTDGVSARKTIKVRNSKSKSMEKSKDGKMKMKSERTRTGEAALKLSKKKNKSQKKNKKSDEQIQRTQTPKPSNEHANK